MKCGIPDSDDQQTKHGYNMTLPPYKLITTTIEWEECLAKIQGEKQLMIDLEANSMFAYRESICLIQISIPGHDYIIDPTVGIDLAALGDIITDPAVEKVFHAGEYDMFLLKRQYGWQLNNLFDTMWAARILGYDKYGLAGMLNTLYGIELDKKYQRSDWCKRPLIPAQLTYARLDTYYLLQMRNQLHAELVAAGRLEEAMETFEQQTLVTPKNLDFTVDDFWKINGVSKLPPRQKAIMRELAIFRDKKAEQFNQPPFKILGNNTLLAVARQKPTTPGQLRRMRGISKTQVQKFGMGLITAVEVGMKAPIPKRPKRSPRRPAQELKRYEALRKWRRETAVARGVESDVIISKEAMHDIAATNPQNNAELESIVSLGAWRCKVYGEEILNLLQRS